MIEQTKPSGDISDREEDVSIALQSLADGLAFLQEAEGRSARGRHISILSTKAEELSALWQHWTFHERAKSA